MFFTAACFADFYTSELIPPDETIEKNLENFNKNVVITNAFKFSKKLYVPIDVVEIIGIKDQSRVYYCYEFNLDKFVDDGAVKQDLSDLDSFQQSPACDNDVKLFRLNNNKWILEMDQVGWRVMEE